MSRANPPSPAVGPRSPGLACLRAFCLRDILPNTGQIKRLWLPPSARQLGTANRPAARLSPAFPSQVSSTEHYALMALLRLSQLSASFPFTKLFPPVDFPAT